MATKKSLPEVTIIPARVAAEAGRFAPQNALTGLPFWSELSASKQETIKHEVYQLVAARSMHIQGGLAMGKHLKAIYNTCEPYSGAFRKICATFSFVERTAYRYMETYDNARQAFHDNIILAAISRGINILSYNKDLPLGKYTEAVKLLPPPKTASPEEAKAYVEKLETTYRDWKRQGGPRAEPQELVTLQSPKDLLKSNFRGIKNAIAHIPPRQRRRWFESLIGMGMVHMNIQSPCMFSPEAIPEEFLQGPGRPRMESEVA